MPAKSKLPADWKEYPEPAFPDDKARDAYREAREQIRQAATATSPTTSLNLSSEGLTALPPEIGQLTALTELYLFDNQLTALPPEIGQLSALTELRLYHNQLTALPPEIGQLTALKLLVLDDNQLTALPPEIGQLTALTGLGLSRNQLTTLPPEIGQLTSLTQLDLFNNQLTALPPEIGQLTALTALLLMDNALKRLPGELRALARLKGLFLHGNPGLRLSPAILGGDPRKTAEGHAKAKSILDYYFGRETAGARPLNEVKLILVGRGGAGKTSTVRALRGEDFHEGEESTPGIALCDWEMGGCKGKPVTAHVWDFAGQVITHALHQFFFSVRSLYLVVLTGRENNERDDAEYWLRLIKAFGTDDAGHGPPVIVVLNKWDVPGCRPRLDRSALQERYPFIRGYVEMDCKTNRGVEKLKKTLCREVDALAWVREPFKKSWDEVRRQLAGGRPKRAHLTYGEFRELCSKHGIAEAGEQDSLSAILHRLGSALNYRDDPRLRESTVLQPQWLTKNVYGLMRRAEKQSGLLRRADVEAVLKAEKDASMRDYLVRLMERFEIAYAPKGTAGTWLVPQALEDTQPKAAEDFRDLMDATRLRYTYPALPEGLVGRAIVRLHDFIEEAGTRRHQWASGAILSREGARALIRTEPQERQVVITVSGPAGPRQQLAGLIQAEMRDIHDEIPGLSPTEETQVSLPAGARVWFSTETLEKDEQKSQKTGVPTKTEGTVMVDPEKENNAYTKKPARSREVWKPSVFISYSKSNVVQRKRLESELKMLKNEGLLAAHWQDRMIDPGDEWDPKIQNELTEADVILVLVSSAALATDYIRKHEIPQAMKQHRAKSSVVVPVILENCRWETTPLGKLNALPEKGLPINKWNPRPDAWKSIADGLAVLFKKLMKHRKAGESDSDFVQAGGRKRGLP